MSNTHRRPARSFVILAVVALGSALGPFADLGLGQPGDASQGAQLLENGGCNLCHSPSGHGSGRAPDLHSGPVAPRTVADMAAGMWNHGPRMWQALAGWNREVPILGDGDIADLYAYLFSRRYMEPRGDPERGARVFTGKNCHRCHALVTVDAGAIGPPVSSWPALADPVIWIQSMWNHGAEMTREFERDNLPHPVLTEVEMADLVAYVRDLPELTPAEMNLAFGELNAGSQLFQTKECVDCHSIGSEVPGKIELSADTRSMTSLTSLAAAMWNHRPWMESFAGAKLEEFKGDEMAQLLSFLLANAYFEPKGDAGQGALTFKNKGCTGCHSRGNSAAPILPDEFGGFSVYYMARAAWRHGPSMHAEMESLGQEWPTLSGQDIADLVAHLNKNLRSTL